MYTPKQIKALGDYYDKYDKRPKCSTCGDSGKKSEIPPDKIYINYLGGTYAGKWQGEKGQQGCNTEYVKVPCPDCTQVEDIMDFVEPEEYLKPDEDRIREAFAETAHKQWSGWMRYMFNKCELQEGYGLIIPEWAVDRWERQIQTEYKDLSKEEKDSDREEADKFLIIHKSALSASDKEIEELRVNELFLRTELKTLRKLWKENQKLNSLLDKVVEGLEMIEHWKDAYPEDIFRPISNDTYYQMCKEWGYSVDRVSAHVLRQGVKGYSESATTLLKEIQEGRL